MAEGPMETERITLSQRERDRLKVLHEVQQRHLTQVAAAARLKVTDRQARRMLLRIREQGDAALVHGLRGRPSNRKLAARFEEKVLTRVGQRYADFGPTLAAEHLAKDGFPLSRETVRRWMTKAAFWHPRRQRVKKIHVWRERRASFGELVMQDSSPFRWLEDRGPACQLIAVIDDATSRIHARFTEHDTTEENLGTFGGWVRRYGRPLAHYTDKNSIFRKGGPQSGSGPHRQLGRKSLGTTAGRRLCGASWSCGRDRTAVGRKPLAALPRPLSAPAGLPRTGAAVRKSFRPTASRTCGTNTETPKPNQTQIPCACRSPLEKTLEADISIWRKPGHFYFALTVPKFLC